jgi:hypothetical protein
MDLDLGEKWLWRVRNVGRILPNYTALETKILYSKAVFPNRRALIL